jgi:hypothetical protein
MQAAVERQQAAVQRAQATAAGSYPTQFAARSTWALIVGSALIITAGVVTLLLVGRKWIARNAGMLFALAGIGIVGMVGLLAVGVPLVFYVRSMDVVVLATEEPAAALADTAADSDTAATSAVETPAEAAPAAVELPDWITAFAKNPIDFNATGTTVLISDQWATVQESEQQLEAQAALLLAQRLRFEHPETSGWRPTNDLIHQTTAITQRFVEPTTLRVGEFDAPMYRSYWQLEYTPGFASAAYSAWKQFAVQQRLWWLGGGTVGLTILFGLAAAALRIDSATGGRYRGRLTFAAVGFCTTLGAAVLLLS